MPANYIHQIDGLPLHINAAIYAGPADLSSGVLPDAIATLGSPCFLHQIHSDKVVEVFSAGAQGEGDALFSTEKGLALCIQTADCVPIFLWNKSGVAAIHAGWRGLAARIISRCIEQFGPPDGALVGPCVSAEKYETGEGVLSELIAAGFPEERIRIEGPVKAHCDLRAAAAYELQLMGCTDIRHHNVCTFSTSELPSYRRNGRRAGRILSVISQQR